MYNVMIVDDEPILKKGLLCFVNWEALHCKVVCDASNGIEATEKLSSHPVDIVVTDIKMPGMDGIELSKYIYHHYPHIKIIILTAFADFSYAQAAIKYNVVDFIIKTNPTEKIPEAVNKAKELIAQQKEKERKLELLENKIIHHRSEICEKFLKDVLNGIVVNRETIDSKIRELDINLHHYFVLAFEINSLSHEPAGTSFEDHNRFMLSVRNFLSLAFKNYRHYSVALDKNVLLAVVSFENGDASLPTQSLLITCNEILSMVDSFMKFTLNIGISRMYSLAQDLLTAYHEAREALQYNFYTDHPVSIYLPETSPVYHHSMDVHRFIDEILSNIRQANRDEALSNLAALLDHYKNHKEPIENIKVSCMLICSLCFRLLYGYQPAAPGLDGNELKIYKQIQESKNIQNLSTLLVHVVESVLQGISSNGKQHNYLVKEVHKYIKDHYNKNVNLQSIADAIHVNSSYLSGLYKKETGESVIDAINKYRIEIAKKLLKDPAHKVFEVAGSVGIEDPAYFTHVFTKYTGMSPKKYKANHP